MKFTNSKSHDFISGLSDTNFCDECGFPSADHHKPECDLASDYVNHLELSMGRLVKRCIDGKWFFEVRQWNGQEWHPLTVGYQSGLFQDAYDKFYSWKRMQQRWEHEHQEAI